MARITVGLLLCFAFILSGKMQVAEAHRSGCHRWHSCPSDRGTYTCGDLGYCSQCPDNRYCLAGRPRAQSRHPLPPSPPEVRVPGPPPAPSYQWR